MRTLDLDLSQIEVNDRLRQVDPEAVQRIALSYGDVGQLQPVEVVAHPTVPDRFVLVSGAHRIAAAHVVGWTRIAAALFEGDRDQLRLREIDENLYRRELSPYDEAAFVVERIEVCQRLGIVPKSPRKRPGDQSANLALSTYEQEIAQKFGISRRSVFRAARRRRSINDAAWQLIGGSSLANKGAMLDALCDVPRERQLETLEAFLAPPEPGERRPSFAALCLQFRGAMPPKLPRPRNGAKR